MADRLYGKLVLIVDDDPDSRMLMQRVVERMDGIRTMPAGDGEEALRQLREQKPDLVLLDLGLPKLDGFGVARRLRADPATLATPVIAVTGLTREVDRERARAAGCDDFIVKPFTPSVLLEKVRQRLGGASAD